MNWECMKKCCRFCQRSQVLNDSSTKILKAGVQAMNSENNVDVQTASSICTMLRNLWNSWKALIDTFWLMIGKPIKHSYDFFRYIRSEVGYVVAKCIKVCCRKSKEKVKKGLVSAREQYRNSRDRIKNKKQHRSLKDKESDSEFSEDSLSADDTIIAHSTLYHYHQRNDHEMRYRGKRNEINDNDQYISAVDGMKYHKQEIEMEKKQ